MQPPGKQKECYSRTLLSATGKPLSRICSTGRSGCTRSFLRYHGFDERGGDAVSAYDAAVHKAKKVAAGMLAGKLQAAVESGFRGHFQHRRILSNFGTGIAAKRVGIGAPEPGGDRRRVETFGHLRRHLGKVVAEGFKRGLRVSQASFDPDEVGDDSSLTRLGATRVPKILKAEIGIEYAVRRCREVRLGSSPHTRRRANDDLGGLTHAKLANAFQLFLP